MPESAELRAEKPRVPAPTRALEQALVERQQLHRERGQALRRSAVRGLLMLALLVLVLSIARAGLGRVFVPGWWRP